MLQPVSKRCYNSTVSSSSALIGATGFVGGNLVSQLHFDELYHSRNIHEIRGHELELLVCAGVTAVKWWANKNAAEDLARIDSLLADLATVKARRVVVLSTIDVYPTPAAGPTEDEDCRRVPTHAYGTNRLYFEERMRKLFDPVTVIRIAGVFGQGLKKNVIFDLLNDNCLDAINPASEFQYYNVANLWRDIQLVEKAGLPLVNFVTEPVRTGDIIDRFFPGKEVGANKAPQGRYDVRTLHANIFGGPEGYLADANTVLNQMGEFIRTYRNE